ncbi:MAG: indolepyruvate ferredoxin oxidoreductase subunit alpha [Firmicutes bacterium]|nr:indolepyruvate ferredoxin oxidoreductase subunit alpha [Bacillota bacterium]
MEKALLLGDEAIARGAWEAGCRVVSSYPGTPSTEVTEAIAAYKEINAEWAPNEKVSLEVAFGAAMAGARAMACMKHVGLNVAADPLFTAAYTGVRAGLVVVVADDPAMFSSQNEQDSRYYARSAHVPILEPSDSQECKDFTALAFALSEQYDTPVLVRLTTRIAHARSLVTLGERLDRPVPAWEKEPQKYVMMPGNARRRHPIVEQREKKLAEDASEMEINRIEMRDTTLGVVCASVCYPYVREAAPDASVFKLGMTYPLPETALRAFAAKVERLIVIEELEPFMEDSLKAMGLPAAGKAETGLQGELGVRKVRRALFGGETRLIAAPPQVLPRPPALCPGCPHRAVFNILRKQKLNVFGDIGCYTLGATPPLNAMDATLCMGASIGMAFGAEKAQGKAFSRKSVAVIGDSTFLHSGVTALIDAVYNSGTITVLILDNRITGMTGHQENPASGRDIYGSPAPMLDLAALCQACGVKHVRTADPYDQKALDAAVGEEVSREAVSVIVVKWPCILLEKEHPAPYHVEGCKACGVCMRLGCPAIGSGADRTVQINPNTCVGCGLCASVCPFGCMKLLERGEHA